MLAEIQRIADREMGTRRAHEFTKAEFMLCRAKWTCELLLNPAPTPERGPIAEAEELAVRGVTGPYNGKKHG